MQLSATLLGSFQMHWAGQPLTFATNTARALVAYLALEADRPHSREELATLFWPDQSQATAFANLRQTLARVRKAFPEPSALPTVLTVSFQTLHFHRAVAAIDVVRFEELLAQCAAHAHRDQAACPECLARLTEAAELYRGDLLHGLFLAQSQPFEEWLLLRREVLHRQALDVFNLLASHFEAAGDYSQMRAYAARQLALEPWREGAHAQMMRAFAYEGERAAALAHYDFCRRVLDEELGVEPSPELVTLREQIQAGTLVRVASRSADAPPASRSYLPVQLTGFIGREREIAEVWEMLDASRLVTVVGAGGMGKTRLALEVGRTQLGQFSDGVFFVALAPVAASTSIATAIADVVGVPLRGDPLHGLQQALRDKKMLLILDNFEHLLDGAGIVLELLQASDITILVTSRERLNIHGEQICVVSGLNYAPDTGLSDAIATSAVRLFVQSVRRVRPDFRLEEAHLGAVQRICELVQGMPLGLELAASWAEVLTLDEIGSEIAASADFLEATWRDMPDRQRSMRAVFAWSWALLSGEEQHAFSRIAVFRGGCTYAAAREVTGASLRLLTRLVHKSLLRWGASGRYEIHELLRQFAAEHLQSDSEEYAAVEARHSAFYLHYASQREHRMTHHEPREATAEIRAELDNIGHAWQWAASHARINDLESSVPVLWFFFLSTGLYAVGEHWFGTAVEYLQNGLERRSFVVDDQQRFQRVLSTLVAYYARVFTASGKFDQAVALAQQAIERAEANGAIEGQALGHFVLGQALSRQEQALAAQPHIQHAVDLAHNNNDRHRQSEVLADVEWVGHIWLGVIAKQFDNLAETEAHFEQSLELCQRSGNLRGEMTSLENLGSVELARGNYRRARQQFEQALHLAQRVGYRWGEAVARLELGDALRCLGEYGLALDSIERAIVIFREIGDLYQECLALSHCGRLYTFAGDYTHAWLHLERALQLIGDTGSLEVEADTFVSLTLFSLYKGDAQQALRYSERGWEVADSMSSAVWQATAQLVMGHALTDLSRFAEATASYGRALDLCTEIDNPSIGAEARAGWAIVALAEGDRASALAHVETVLPVLDGNPAIGLDEPFRVYLACFRVLEACGDPRTADIVQAANRRLDAYAGSIADAELRISFLAAVATHRALRDAGAKGI